MFHIIILIGKRVQKKRVIICLSKKGNPRNEHTATANSTTIILR